MALWNNHLPISRKNSGNLAQNDFSDLFDRLQREFFSPDFSSHQEGNFSPKVEVKEQGKNYLVCAELPGMTKDDINITLRDNELILEGEKKQENKKEEKGFYSSEFSYGSFYRSIPLRSEVNSENVSASYKDGILTVKLEKSNDDRDRTKKIEIQQ